PRKRAADDRRDSCVFREEPTPSVVAPPTQFTALLWVSLVHGPIAGVDRLTGHRYSPSTSVPLLCASLLVLTIARWTQRMNGKSVLWGIGIALFLAGAVGVVFLLIRHEPEFYRETAQREVEGKKTRTQRSGEFLSRLNQFHQDVAFQTSWNAEFREDL